MIALVLATCHHNRCSTKDFFRAAYQKKFGKDMPPQSLAEDVDDFDDHHAIPQYVVDYIVARYGQQC